MIAALPINTLIYREIIGIPGIGNGAQGRNRATDTAIFSFRSRAIELMLSLLIK